MKKSGAERLQESREKKREQQRERARRFYQNHREAILEERRKRYSSKCTSGPFPNRMSEKRALDEVKSALPESPEKKVYIVAKLVQSPITRKKLEDLNLVTSSQQQKQMEMGCAVLKDVEHALSSMKERRSDDKRIAAGIGLAMVCGEAVAKGNLRKPVAKALNINHHRIAMSLTHRFNVLSDPNSLWMYTERKTRSDSIPEEHKKLAHDFWASPTISRPTGNKKDVIRQRVSPNVYVSHEKQILEKTQTEAFLEFRDKYPDIKMGQRSFEKCKPFFVTPPREQDRNSCCCRVHVEMRMIFQVCMAYRKSLLEKDPTREGVYPLYTHLNDLVNVTLCEKEDGERLHRLCCLCRECDNCGVNKLPLMAEELDVSETTVKLKWQAYEYVNVNGGRRIQIVTKETPPGELFSKLKLLLVSFPSHQFRSIWQHDQMKKLAENLPLGHVCCVHDYSENYTCRFQDQIQSMYFSQTQASLHVTILHRHALLAVDNEESTEEEPKIVTEHIFVIPSDCKHDHHSVHGCRALVANYLKEINYKVKVMHEWTDGCSAQYKSRHCMGDISYSEEDFGFKTIRNFYETSHAKGPQDGAGANVKHKADMAVIKHQVIIRNAADLYEFCVENLQQPAQSQYQSENVNLQRRIFFYVEQTNRERRTRYFKEVKGNRSIHSIETGESGRKLRVRKLSCYCDGCMENGVCSNVDYVDVWEEVEMDHEAQMERRSTRADEQLQREQIQDLVAKDSTVAIAAADRGEDYYLLKVPSNGSEVLNRPTTDGWGASYPAGANIFRGHFYIREQEGTMIYWLDQSKEALVYAAIVRFICGPFNTVIDGIEGRLSFKVPEQQHLDILESLNGF